MLGGILSISGQPGLFKLVSQTKNGIIVESLETKKRQPIFSNSKVSALEDIAIFTTGEELPIKEVFKKIYSIENRGQASVSKSSTNSQVMEYFEDVLPDYDKDRVYVSDMRKLFNWYNLLVKENVISDESIKADNEASNVADEAETPATPVSEPVVAPEPSTPESPKKTKKAKNTEEQENDKAEAPKPKKSTPKKEK